MPLDLKILDDFKRSIEDLEVDLSHPNCEHPNLNDLFVFPDFKALRGPFSKRLRDFRGEKILGTLKDIRHLIIFGDEQAGKTTLAKKIFLDSYFDGFIPILLKGEKIRSSNIRDALPKIISETYSNTSLENLIESQKCLCILDGISDVGINTRSKGKLIANLASVFPYILILSESPFQFASSDFPELDDYGRLEILPFGYVRRSELITKWVDLELTETAHEQEIWGRIDELNLHIDSLVRKNVVPAKPFYILMFIQSFGSVTSTNQRLELTSYGHCYQFLIYQALERAQVKQDEIDAYLNYLSELGRAILDSPHELLDESELSVFRAKYAESFLAVNQDKLIQKLTNASILENTDAGLRFRYRYLFYFFAAKNLADSLRKGDSAKNRVIHLIDTIHLDQSSNIVLFLTHHSKDPWVFEQILYSVMDVLTDRKEATLEADSLSFLKGFIDKIPAIVMENRDPSQERLKHNSQKDALARYEQENIEEQEAEDDNLIKDDASSFVRMITKMFRATEVCGQILRNRVGSLERSELEFFYEESLTAMLRFLDVILKSSEYVQDEAIRIVQRILQQSPDLSDSEVTQKAETFYVELNYAIILSILYKISSSLGSVKGREIYLKVAENKGTAASKLIQEVIELQFEKRLEHNKIKRLYDDLADNQVCARLLKQIVLRHCYMHDISMRDRQKLSTSLNMPLESFKSIPPSKK